MDYNLGDEVYVVLPIYKENDIHDDVLFYELCLVKGSIRGKRLNGGKTVYDIEYYDENVSIFLADRTMDFFMASYISRTLNSLHEEHMFTTKQSALNALYKYYNKYLNITKHKFNQTKKAFAEYDTYVYKNKASLLECLEHLVELNKHIYKHHLPLSANIFSIPLKDYIYITLENNNLFIQDKNKNIIKKIYLDEFELSELSLLAKELSLVLKDKY